MTSAGKLIPFISNSTLNTARSFLTSSSLFPIHSTGPFQKMRNSFEEPLLKKMYQYQRACKDIDILINEKKITADDGEVFLMAIKLCDKITRTYHLVATAWLIS
ncbi:hypothetical protein AJ78_05291 [Emergomyces pasteurianus Ep9510]|uniref:Uncharacterized protein n=1 Tax=Emergomyces pasteurianus Ep9510 TaxID=1447872 RepID=A0A1J9QEI5_9EURO|nr:hypothetical protein AJ78_05291 [Emergomyces pasteurianus Ep9510]